jgi:hypothetical protein
VAKTQEAAEAQAFRTYPAFAITPPSTKWIAPVTKLARSEAR